jgi:hypothetical protein
MNSNRVFLTGIHYAVYQAITDNESTKSLPFSEGAVTSALASLQKMGLIAVVADVPELIASSKQVVSRG